MSAVAAETPSQDVAAESAPRGRSGFRQMTDAILSLAVAVVLVRAFAVEGYMISTGSMAPTLPGFHKRATCPDCRYEFAVGAADDDELSQSAEHHGDGKNGNAAPSPDAETAVCPNCGRSGIDLSAVRRNQGDQLLVYKNAYLFREPRRWEVVVFRNPDRPVQAYVKRVVGLPGETVEIIDGDLWINGERARKDLRQQRAVRIPVFEQQFAPQAGPNWQPRWVPEGSGEWSESEDGFAISESNSAGRSADHWVAYRHWVREGGQHRTAVKVPAEISQIDFSFPSLYPLRFDGDRKELWVAGVLSDTDAERISATYSQPGFAELVRRLAKASHLSPVIDDYGYNRRRDSRQPVAVRDLMVSFQLTLTGGNGRFYTEMTDGDRLFRFTLDVGTRDVSLAVAGEKSPISRARLKAAAVAKPLLVEMSLFDRQVLVAINGHAVFQPALLRAVPKETPAPRRPVRFGSSGLAARVSGLRLFRDIYYTHKGRGGNQTVADGEYFVLGDNSPISADSRVWPRSGVPRSLLLGKPFLVHLPSRPGRLRVGKFEMNVRIPDFSRIRYIR